MKKIYFSTVTSVYQNAIFYIMYVFYVCICCICIYCIYVCIYNTFIKPKPLFFYFTFYERKNAFSKLTSMHQNVIFYIMKSWNLMKAVIDCINKSPVKNVILFVKSVKNMSVISK